MSHGFAEGVCSEAAVLPLLFAEGVCSEAAFMPCVLLETKICGKDIFLFSKSLSLTKEEGWEKLATLKINELNINKKFVPIILDTIEMGMPLLVLLFFGFLLSKNKS